MLKHTLYFGNPAYLCLRNSSLVIKFPENENKPTRMVPVEDVAYIILDSPQLTITQQLLAELLEYDIAVITCNSRHMPVGLNLPLASHTLQSERFRDQINASLPLKKQLWRQTVKVKIANQAAVLQSLNIETGNMQAWVSEVRSGDPSNLEARAAVYYWRNIFPHIQNFVRDRYGDFPNNYLNLHYSYSFRYEKRKW